MVVACGDHKSSVILIFIVHPIHQTIDPSTHPSEPTNLP